MPAWKSSIASTVAAMAVAVTCVLPCAAAPDPNPGEWQITARTEMTGMPMQVPPQSVTFTSCVTPEQPVPTDSQNKCKVFDIKTEGKAVSWSVECNADEGKMKGSGKIVYDGDTLNGEQKMTVSAAEGMNLDVVMHMSGKRLGPCKEKN